MIHNSLHAKIYLLEFHGDRCLYSVGSSNLTSSGMGYRWSECNVVGQFQADYSEVEKNAMKILGEHNRIERFDQWERRMKKLQRGLGFFS